MVNEKDRLSRAVKSLLWIKAVVPEEDIDKVVHDIVPLILREIKRAERRERDACLADVDRYTQSVAGFDDERHDGAHLALLRLGKAIRNRRKV